MQECVELCIYSIRPLSKPLDLQWDALSGSYWSQWGFSDTDEVREASNVINDDGFPPCENFILVTKVKNSQQLHIRDARQKKIYIKI